MQYMGQQKADHAMTSTFRREQDRQKAFQAEQNAAFQDSLGDAGTIADPAKQAAAAAVRNTALMAATKSAAPTAGAYLPGGSGGNPVVQTAGEVAGKRADAHTASLGQALASLGGLSDLFQRANIGIGRNAQTIDQAAGFARGSRDVLQSEMDAAKQKGGNLRMLGSLAQTIGGMMAGGAGGIPTPTPGSPPIFALSQPSLFNAPSMQSLAAAL
jgi:hypothetical protein